MRESRAPELARHFDVAGAVTVTGGLMLLVYGLTRAPKVGWSSAETIGSFAGFAILIAVAMVIERRSRSPLLDLGIFRRRPLSGANLIGLMLGTTLFGSFFPLTLYQQDVLGFSPLRTGVGNLAIALMVIGGSTIAQALVTRIGVKPVLMLGLTLLGGGLTVSTTRTNNLLAKGVANPTALTDGFRLAFWVAIGFAAVALASTSIVPKRRDLRPEALAAESSSGDLAERRAA